MNDMHLQIEKTFFELAKGEGKNCLVLCDRGIMDLSVCKSLHAFCCLIIISLVAKIPSMQISVACVAHSAANKRLCNHILFYHPICKSHFNQGEASSYCHCARPVRGLFNTSACWYGIDRRSVDVYSGLSFLSQTIFYLLIICACRL